MHTSSLKPHSSQITRIPEILQKPHLQGLDGLRGVAILFVVTSHILFQTAWNRYFDGRLGVDIFFVISGFLITTLLLKEKIKHGKVSLKKFYIKRALRILPVAYLYLIVLFLLNFLFNLKINNTTFTSTALFVRNLPIKGSVGWQTGHYWSLSVEEQFYIVFPFFIVRKTRWFLISIVIIILSLPFLVHLGYNTNGIFDSNKLLHSFLFLSIFFLRDGVIILIGSLLAFLTFRYAHLLSFTGGSKYLSLILFVLALGVQALHPAFTKPEYYVVHYLFAFIIGAVIIINLSYDNFFLRILESKLLKTIGVLSYSIYIWQQLFTVAQPWQSSFSWGSSIFFNISLLIIVASCSYYFYEKRWLKLKDKL